MEVTKRVHPVYKDQQKSDVQLNMVGKYQYFYSSDKGKISLVELGAYHNLNFPWEIYSLEGNLFDDVERFETKEEAEKRIKEILN